MIITHKDADGFSAAGLLILATNKDLKESIENLRYSTVSYLNKLTYQLRKKPPESMIIIDLNADDTEKYTKNLIALAKKGYNITIYDHHQFHNDEKLKKAGINIYRDTTISATELLYKHCIDKRMVGGDQYGACIVCLQNQCGYE